VHPSRGSAALLPPPPGSRTSMTAWVVLQPHRDYCLSLVSWALYSLVVSVSSIDIFEHDILMIYLAALTFTREMPHCPAGFCSRTLPWSGRPL
jgi:hypothetical protein